MQILKRSIIGLVILIGLMMQAQSAHAIYSPRISKEMNVIKQHILAARQVNGAGTLLSAAERIAEQETELRKQGKAVSLPGGFTIAMAQVTMQSFKEIILAPYDPIFMIFNIIPSTNSVITDCLRNDIWTLEDLRDAVTREMTKAYLMGDLINGDKLMTDFKYLTDNISKLKKYGSYPLSTMNVNGVNMTSSEYFFGYPSAINSYILQIPSEERQNQIEDMERCVETCTAILCGALSDEEECADKCEDDCDIGADITWSGCPQSDFLAAFDEVRESWENLKVMSAGGGSGWGSIWEMATARARIKADQWIKANQISLTIGGEEGGNPQSLLKDDGLNKFVGKLKTQGKIVMDMIGPFVPVFTWSIYVNSPGETSPGCMYYYPDEGIFRACTSEQILDYLECTDPESTKEDLKGIYCDRYKQPGSKTVAQTLDDYQYKIVEYEKRVQKAQTTFVYHMQLNSVGENNLQAMDAKLSEINTQIMRGYEAMGDKSGPALPSLFKKLSVLIAKHCGGD